MLACTRLICQARHLSTCPDVSILVWDPPSHCLFPQPRWGRPYMQLWNETRQKWSDPHCVFPAVGHWAVESTFLNLILHSYIIQMSAGDPFPFKEPYCLRLPANPVACKSLKFFFSIFAISLELLIWWSCDCGQSLFHLREPLHQPSAFTEYHDMPPPPPAPLPSHTSSILSFSKSCLRLGHIRAGVGITSRCTHEPSASFRPPLIPSSLQRPSTPPPETFKFSSLCLAK